MINSILITGANGLLGRIFAEHLSKSGYKGKIFGIDNADEGVPSKRFILDQAADSVLLNQPFCGKYYKVDVTKLHELENIFQQIGTIDIVIHFATAAETETPDLIKHVNELGTENIFQICDENKIGKVIFASSIMTVAGKLIDEEPYCYINNGTSESLPEDFKKVTTESTAIPKKSNSSVVAYITSKLKGEDLASRYVSKGISTICLRLGAISSTNIPYNTPGLRSIWCSHQDACFFISLAIENLSQSMFPCNRIYFVCSDNDYLWVDMTSSKCDLGFVAKDKAETFLNRLVLNGQKGTDAGFTIFSEN